MNDRLENQNAHENGADELFSTPDEPQVDFLLRTLVDLVNRSGLSLGITLCVGGAIISGQLISGKDYFQGIADDLLESSCTDDQRDVRNSFSDFFRSVSKTVYEKPHTMIQSEDEDEDADKPARGFIHLGKAKFLFDSKMPIPIGNGMLWRGRLSKIDGFCLTAIDVS